MGQKKDEWQSNEFCYFCLQLYVQFSRYPNGERIPATIVVNRSTGNSIFHCVSAQVRIIVTPVLGHRLGSWIEHSTFGVQRRSEALNEFLWQKAETVADGTNVYSSTVFAIKDFAVNHTNLHIHLGQVSRFGYLVGNTRLRRRMWQLKM